MERYVEPDPILATVDDRRRSNHRTAGRHGHVYRLAGRAAGRDDVLDDQHTFARVDTEAAAQCQSAVPALGEQGTDTQGSRHLVADDDPA